MLTRALTVDSKAVQRHRATILECVKDSDASIQRRALELIYLLVNVNNVKPLAKELIEYLEVREQDFKGVLTAKICSIERSKLFAPEKIWYIDQMLKVLSEAGNYVKDDVWHALIVVITNAPDLHGRTNYGEYHHPAVFVVTCDWYCRWKLCVPHILKNVNSYLEDFSDDLPVSRLKYNALDDFQEVFQTTSISVVWTSWKSSGLPGSRMDFLKVVWTS
uniref:Clathrin/coatomer adaptor adaptin-like N-terminal domain-containing protein n=1 Tax=Brassica campestris TaxID=3711 RepID=M4ERV1_BRACM